MIQFVVPYFIPRSLGGHLSNLRFRVTWTHHPKKGQFAEIANVTIKDVPGLPPPLKYWLTQFRWLKPLGNQWWLYSHHCFNGGNGIPGMFLVAADESVVTWKVLLQKTNPQEVINRNFQSLSPWKKFSSSPLRIYQDPKGHSLPTITRSWFQIFFYVHFYLGKSSSLTNIFRMGWNHQLVIWGGRAVKLREVFFVQRNGFVFCRSTSGVHYLQQNLSNRWLWDFQRPRRTWEPIKTHTIHIPLSCSNP